MEDANRNQSPQLIKFAARSSAGSAERRFEVDGSLNNIRKSIGLGATVLKDLAKHSRIQAEAAEKAISSLQAELDEEKGRYKTLKSRFDAAEEHHHRTLSAAEQKISELETANKSLADDVQAKVKELEQLRWFLESLVSDVEAIRDAASEANEVLTRHRAIAE